jgi:site-specific DNA-methyltransferase (adenine-specific)
VFLDDGDLTFYHGDSLEVLRQLPSGIAQTCVTSPPYWGLRDYGATGQLGLEATPDEYVQNMVALFREVRRVLRDDGSLWVNLGDSYSSGGRETQCEPSDNTGKPKTVDGGARRAPNVPDLKPKDLVGIPWRVAFALQTDGWYLRSDIIWAKPNPMPESVTDRPTKAHEYLFLLTKRPKYYFDADAIREDASPNTHSRGSGIGVKNAGTEFGQGIKHNQDYAAAINGHVTARNRRSVWVIPTEPFPEAHFATYPQALVQPCILAGTSERGGCVECGAPWQRVVEREGGRRSDEYRAIERTPKGSDEDVHGPLRQHADMASGLARPGWRKFGPEQRDERWEPSCSCAAKSRAQLVLDPFIGSGTTALVARKHGRRCIGIDLSAEYLEIAAKRTQQLSLLGGAA